MTPADIDRVFGRGRLRMVTGDHVEVFREASQPGERRRYTKRFLATPAGDFSEWTEREWRILARLVGHGIKPVPDVVRFDRGAADRPALVQTYDAGVTVDHWATLLPLERDGARLRNVFEDCAHWWALARHSLVALDAIHELRLVHLDLKADNVCIPAGPADFDPHSREHTLQPRFDEIALIDFAFSLVSGERLDSALPIAQQADYEYQSPRLLRALEAGRHGDLGPTRQLDWRCDLFSLAAMLWRYLPDLEDTRTGAWSRPRHARARALVRRLIEAHDAALPVTRPHAELIAFASEALEGAELRESLQRGWRLTVERGAAAAASPTPITRIAMPVPAQRPKQTQPAPDPTLPPQGQHSPTATAPTQTQVPIHPSDPEPLAVDPTDVAMRIQARHRQRLARTRRLGWSIGLAGTAAAALAAAAWLEPGWLSVPRDEPALRLALAPQAQTAAGAQGAGPSPAVSAAPTATAPEPAAASAPAENATAAVAEQAGLAAARGVASAAADAPAKPAAAARPPAPVRGRGADLAAAPDTPTRTTPTGPGASPGERAGRSAPAAQKGTRAAPPSPRLAVAAAPRRLPPTSAKPAGAGPIPWAVAGRSAPRTASLGVGIGARPVAATSATSPRPFPATATRTAAIAPAAVAAAPAPREPAAARPTGAPTAAATPPSPGAAATVVAAAPVPPAATSEAARAAAAAAAGAAPEPVPASPPAAPTGDVVPVDYAVRASELMAQQVPRLAQRAERLVARVLFVAGRSDRVPGDEDIRAAVAALGRDAGDALSGMPLAAREAQRLGAAARAEYARRGGSAEAVLLQARAFGANPLDADAAGNLAFLLLRQRPAQPEAARQLALHALTLHGTRQPEGRLEDWATFAIASALSGRERDARNAFLVVLSLSPDVERQCRAALDVHALYGERLRAPVEALLQSASASGRTGRSSSCEWPPRWTTVSGSASR